MEDKTFAAILPLLSVTQAALIEIRTARSAEVSGAAGGGSPTAAQDVMAARPLPVIPGEPECVEERKKEKRRFTRLLLSDSRRHEQLPSPRMPPPLPSLLPRVDGSAQRSKVAPAFWRRGAARASGN